MRGLYSGVSGMLNHQTKMDVIGDNISNINTVGFKRSNVVFQSFMSQLLEIAHAPQDSRGGTGPEQIGLGSKIGSIDRNFQQGDLQRTDNDLDVAIEGNGFFVINDGTACYYTRAGHFALDSEGNIIMNPGLKLQGWMATKDPVTGQMTISSSTTPIGDLQIKTGDIIPAKATTNLTFNGNLNSENDIALEPITVEWSAGNSVSPTISKVTIEFEHAHPDLPYYIWTAKWAENPPAGYKVGDAVIDENTKEAATGIIEINEQGYVVNNYINTNQSWVVNASNPIMSTQNTGTASLEQIYVRNQDDCTKALWEIDFNKLPDGTFDTTKYYIRVSFDNGQNWHDVNDVVDGLGNTMQDATGKGLGDTTKTTIFTYVDNSNGSNYMAAQITIPAYFWTGTAAAGDKITFTTQKSDNTSRFTQILNLPNEKPKLEDDWGQYTATVPSKAGTNNVASGTLSRIIANTGMQTTGWVSTINPGSTVPALQTSVQLDNSVAPNSQFTIKFATSPASATQYTVYDENDKAIGVGTTTQNFYKSGVYIPASAWTGATINAGDQWTFNAAQVDNAPASYVLNFTSGTEYNIYKLTNAAGKGINVYKPEDFNSATDFDALVTNGDLELLGSGLTTKDFKSTPTASDPISIPWTNWHGSFAADDVFTFQTHAARSSETGHRDFFRVKDSAGNITEIFIPSGSITGADPIAFEPNTTETTTASDLTFGVDSNQPDVCALSGNPVTATFNNKDDYQYITDVNVYDSLGKAHNVKITFEKKSDNLWMWSIADPDPADPENVGLAGYGLLAFKADGSYDPSNSITFESEVGLNNADSKGPIAYKGIYFDPPGWGGAPLPGSGANPVMITSNFTDLHQFAAANDGEVYSQDGYAKGTLTSYAINEYGIISGFYDNGQALDIGQIALANFNNANGLMSMGGSLFRTTSNSGLARIGVAGTAGRGIMASGNLEQSNVDMATEFADMIITQRGFSANSRTITTADQMLQELLSLKR